MLTRTRPVDILLIEDNRGDVRLIREGLGSSGVAVNLHVTTDSDQALAFLRKEAPFHDAARPDLILLDLHLPNRSGRNVLAAIKADPSLLPIPVVALTASEADREICDAYALHSNCFITKPVHVDAYLAAINAIVEFWFNVARLPQKCQEA